MRAGAGVSIGIPTMGGGVYLSRSSDLMAVWIPGCDINGYPPSVSTIPIGSLTGGSITQIERGLRLCLFADVPRYLPNYYAEAANYRSAGYTYCAECFARLVLSTAVLPLVKGRDYTIRTHVVQKLVGESRDASSLIPANYRVVARILEGGLSFTSVSSVRRRCADYLFNNGEFRAMRRDGAYKVIMSLSGQPRRGVRFRKYVEIADWGNREAAGGIQVVRTLRTLSGATIGASARFSGSRSVKLDCAASALSGESREYASSCEVVFTDRAMDLDRRSTWG